jgi:exodeoxyribonuclease-3
VFDGLEDCPMRIATWNVNSVRARLPRVLEWLAAAQPDVLCMQELKCQDEQFPAEGFADLGYNLEVFGQKSWNGVAIASRHSISGVMRGVPDAEDTQSRGLAVITAGLFVVNLYVPNGSEVGSDKYAYKLQWLDKLADWLDQETTPDDDILVTGDFNICPDDRDVYDPDAWHEKILCSTPERARFQRLIDWGLTDALRHFDDSPGVYTWWDYRAAMFRRGLGLRIDHHLVSPSVLARATGVEIDREARKGEKPSDHAPVTLVIEDTA